MRVKLFIIICVLFACNPVKKVLNNPDHYNRVKDSVIARGACVNDTTYVYKPGRIDSVPFPVPIVKKEVDPLLLQRAIDSAVNKNDELCLYGLQESYKFGYNDAIDSIRKLKQAVKQPDTLKGYVRDSALLDVLHRSYQKQLADSSSLIQATKTKLLAAEAAAAEWERKAKKLFWYLWLFVGGLLIAVFRKHIWKLIRKLIFKV